MQNIRDELFLKQLGNRIRYLRKLKGMSQLDLGVKIDNYAEQIGRIERGESNITICSLKLIAEGLEITLAELFEKIDII